MIDHVMGFQAVCDQRIVTSSFGQKLVLDIGQDQGGMHLIELHAGIAMGERLHDEVTARRLNEAATFGSACYQNGAGRS